MRQRVSWIVIVVVVIISVWILNTSTAGKSVQGCLQDCASKRVNPGNEVRILSLNMLHGFPGFKNLRERSDLIAGEILAREADLVLLQEVPWSPSTGNCAEYLAGKTGMNFVYLRANGNRWALFFEEGEAILSRYPLSNVSFIELQPRAGFFEHRVVLHAVATTPKGDIDLFVTHLTNGEDTINQGQANSLLQFVTQTATKLALVAGDFNATDETPQILSLSKRWLDSFRAAHPADTGSTCCVNDLTATSPEILQVRIDYLFIVTDDQQAFRIKDATVIFDQPFATTAGWQWASDHAGLLVTLEIR